MTRYTCKECGKEIKRTSDGGVIRDCGCDAPIIAHLKATATGESSVAKGK
jgi:DNA-directed RNA polymerase subunit RPC12/RpoP